LLLGDNDAGENPFLLTWSGDGVVGAATSFPSWRRHWASWLPTQTPPRAGGSGVDMVLRGTLCENAFLFLFSFCEKSRKIKKRKKEKKSTFLVVSSFSFERGRREVVVRGYV
jgi:hypothetical protein